MPELSNEELARFQEMFAPLAGSFAASLTENINQVAVLDPPLTTQELIGDLISDPEPNVQVSFAFPALHEDEAALLFSEPDSRILADLISLGDGSQPPQTLEPAQLENLTAALTAFAQGIGAAIGDATGRPVDIGPGCSTNLAPLTLSTGFITEGHAVQIAFPYRVEGLLDSTFRLLITPALARAIAQLPPANDSELEGPSIHLDSAPGYPAGAFGGGDGIAEPFQPFLPVGASAQSIPRGMDLIMDIPLDVSVELGRVQMLIKDVLELATGSIVELERVAGEPVDLMVNGQLIAKGEVVVIEDNFGIRITEIVSTADRLTGAAKRVA